MESSLNNFLEQAREQSHPSRMQWDLYLLHGLSETEHNQLEHHLQGCQRCRQKFDSLQAERTSFQANMGLPAFLQAIQKKAADSPILADTALDASHAHTMPVAELLAEVHHDITTAAHSQELLVSSGKEVGKEEATRAGAESQPGGWMHWLQRLMRPVIWAPVGVCAALLFVLFTNNNPEQSLNGNNTACLPLDSLSSAGIRRKGSPELTVFLFRQGQRFLATSGATFFKDDILALRYKSSGYRYLSIVYIDNKGKLSYLYPERPAPSIAVTEHGDLDGSVQLDGAKGTERLLAFFSTRPLQPKEVQALLQQNPTAGPLRLACHSANRIFLRTWIIQKK